MLAQVVLQVLLGRQRVDVVGLRGGLDLLLQLLRIRLRAELIRPRQAPSLRLAA